MKQCVSIFLMCFLPFFLQAQTFKGSVKDEAGNPIPYASIYLRELQTGFTADDEGRFQIPIPDKGNYTCEVSSIGFVGQTLTFSLADGDVERHIVLAEQVYNLQEISIVKGNEDPAYQVMRQAIARAPYHRTQVKAFRAGTYLKGTGKLKAMPAVLKLSSEGRKVAKEVKGKLFVMEEQRSVRFRAPDTWESRVTAYSNSFPEEMEAHIGLTTINFYEPTVFGIISPLNEKAFRYYRFKLEGCYQEGDRWINKIRVIPRHDNPELASGDLYIVEDLWCVSAAELSIHISGIRATVKTTCKEVRPSVFLATSTSMKCDVKLMGVAGEASYLAAVHYSQVEVEGDAPSAEAAPVKAKQVVKKRYKYERTSPMKKNETVTTDSLAGKRDSLYWAAVRSVPLRPEEVQSYDNKQKLEKMDTGLLTDKDTANVSVAGRVLQTFFLGRTFRTHDKHAWISAGGLGSYVPEYNFVDGFWLGAKFRAGVKLSPSATLRLVPSVYYTSARRSVVGEAKISLRYAPRRLGYLLLSGGRVSADYNEEQGESRKINALASALFAQNDVKLFDKAYVDFRHEIELANSLLFTASLSWQRRQSLDNRLHRSWFKKTAKSNVPDNPFFQPMPKNERLRASFALEYTPAHYYRMYEGQKVYDNSRYPTLALRYDRAFPLKGSLPSPSYHLAELTLCQRINFGMFNTLNWQANAGRFWKAEGMQFPDFKHFDSGSFPLTMHEFDTHFALPGNYAYSTGSRWVQAHVNWYTPYLLLKWLPFLKRQSWNEALHLGTVISHGRHAYSEIGYSVGTAGFARLGVFVGFDRLKCHSAGMSVCLPLADLIIGE